MGAFTSAAKRIVLAGGLYRPARWIATRARPARLKAFREEVALYHSLLPDNALCFDVGANIGERSEALLAAGARRVVAFEPDPRAIREARGRCSHDRRWTMIEAAVGKGPSVMPFHLAPGSPESSLDSGWIKKGTTAIEVPVVSLDSAIAMWGLPDYCKIDVEGWELEVLSGLSQAFPLVSFEFHLDSTNVQRTKACLARLIQLSADAQVNVTPAEGLRLHFTEWRSIREFAEWFPGDLKDTLPRWKPFYGDIFVRRPPIL